jgi:hypothetical protein
VSDSGEFLAKLLIVLNNAIVNYGHSATAIGVRVGVELSDSAMGCPTSVSDGYIAGKACQVMFLDNFVNLAGVFLYQ